jgi:hypothetical protein
MKTTTRKKKRRFMMKLKTKAMAVAIALSVIFLTPAVLPAAEDGEAQVHGFVSQGYLGSDGNDYLADTKEGSFQFNEVGVNFSAEPVDKLRIGVQLFSRDLGEMDNNRIELDWAFADYHWQDELGFRLGRFQTPHGLYHDTIDLDMVRTTVFLPFSTYEIRYRSFLMTNNGANAYGNVGLGALGSIDYITYAGTNIGEKESGELLFKNDMDVESVDMKASYGGRLIWNTPLDGFLLGGSYARAEDLTVVGKMPDEATAPIPLLGGLSLYPAGTKMIWNAEDITGSYLFMQYTLNRLTLASEYHRMQMEVTQETDNSFDPFVGEMLGYIEFEDYENNASGWYAQANYQFIDWLTAAVTYGEYYADADDPEGEDFEDIEYTRYQKDTTLSMRFDVNPNWNIKLEAHMMDGTAKLISGLDYGPDDELEENWNLYAVKTSFYF